MKSGQLYPIGPDIFSLIFLSIVIVKLGNWKYCSFFNYLQELKISYIDFCQLLKFQVSCWKLWQSFLIVEFTRWFLLKQKTFKGSLTSMLYKCTMCLSFFIAHNIFQIDLYAIEKEFCKTSDKPQQGDCIKGAYIAAP